MFSGSCRQSFFLVTGVFLLLAGCTTGTRVDGAWQSPRPVTIPYDNVLVVAISSYGHARKAIEKRMVDDISSHGTRATASFHIERKMGDRPLSREHVMAMAGEASADAVLVTRMLSRTADAGKSKAEAYVDIGPQVEVIETGNITQVWAGNYSVHQTEGQLIAMSDVHLESAVYDVADNGRVVYIVSTESTFREDGNTYLEDVSDEIADSIIKEVRQAGLVN